MRKYFPTLFELPTNGEALQGFHFCSLRCRMTYERDAEGRGVIMEKGLEELEHKTESCAQCKKLLEE